MKNLIIFASIIFCLATISCGNSKTDSAEQQRIADSIEQAKRDSAEFADFRTPDLTTYFVHGHVKSVTTTDQHETLTYNFTKDGKRIDYYGTRDDQGRYISEEDSSDIEFIVIKKYSYTKEGLLASYDATDDSRFYTHRKFFYDKKGCLDYEEFEWNNHGCGDGTIKYEILETDKYGNWTKAKLIEKSTFSYFDEKDTSNTSIMTREIEYYTPEELK